MVHVMQLGIVETLYPGNQIRYLLPQALCLTRNLVSDRTRHLLDAEVFLINDLVSLYLLERISGGVR